MADYTEEVDSAYEDIAEAGGLITIIGNRTTAPADPDLPWQGSEEEDDNETPHVAVFFPLKDSLLGQSANPFAESCLIPAKGLDFEVKTGLMIRKENGEVLVVVNVIALRPNGVQPILYTCEVNTWPGT